MTAEMLRLKALTEEASNANGKILPKSHIFYDSLTCALATDMEIKYETEFYEEATFTEQCSSQYAELDSLRKLINEPYHESFFEIDPNSQIYYLRHTVLFNLYNFPGGVSIDPSLVASL